MGLDFTKIGKTSLADTSTDPRSIFNALPKRSSKYSYPRAGQTDVWERWHLRRNDSDIVVKMNTGAGKTVVGLLILKSSLNEGAGPALFVTPDNYLRDQVRAEAAELGIETTDDPFSPRFQQSKAILVVSIYRLVNGQSVFGVTGSGRQPIELGTVLVDDVHACLETVEDQFSLRLERGHDAYEKLVSLFREDLAAQSAPSTQDLLDNFGYPQFQVPYWAWSDKQATTLSILQRHRQEDAFQFAWPLISECLPLCRVAITNEAIEVKPPVPPIHRIPSLAKSKRRVYLTATLPDDSVLVTHFAARPESLGEPITAKAADDLGDRMILTPLETHPDANEPELQRILGLHARHHNVVVVVPSRRRADAWRHVAARVHDRNTIEDGVRELREGHVGLVVLVNKYDGIDLPDDACRILVIDGLPEAYSPIDRIDAVTLAESEALVTRQVQRIEQGMGRGVRSSTDYCVVLLLGARLTQRLNSAAGYARLSAATRAQVELSRRVAEMLHGRPVGELSGVIDQCLTRDTAWVVASRSALSGVTYATRVVVSEAAIAQRKAFDFAEMGRPREAHDVLQTAIASTQDVQMRGWLKQQAAAYLHVADAVQAQKLQFSAQSDNRALLKPRTGVEYRRLQGTSDQATRAAEFLSATYRDDVALQVGIHAILDDLSPAADPAAVEAFEQAMRDLAEHLGFEAQRPERDTGAGPDVLWKIGDLTFLVIECKSGVTTEFIAKNDAAQLSASIDWFEKMYDKTWCEPVPLMVHRVAKLHHAASPRDGMRVVTFEKLDEFRAAIGKYASGLATSGAYRNSARVAEHLQALELSGGTLLNKWSIEPTRG